MSDYKKKYEDAVARATDFCDKYPESSSMLETIFPELKGGKDERIRKRLLKIANTWKEGGYACGNSDEIDDIIAWLEKQGQTMKKEDGKEFIIEWFEHISQIANDRKTANNVVMSDQEALNEIKCYAKEAAEYIRRFC